MFRRLNAKKCRSNITGNKIRNKLKRHKAKVIFIAMFAVGGALMMLSAWAGSSTAYFEAENASRTGSVSVVSDTGASSGQAIKFSQAVACSGVNVTPNSGNLANFVKGYSSGTTFCFEPGVYNVTEVIFPKSDQKLIAKPGAILDGGGVTEEGLKGYGGYQDRITVKGFEIRNFALDGIETGADWRVIENDIHDNRLGLRMKKSSQAIGNKVHNNFKYGVVINGPYTDPDPGEPILLEDNEISYNNTLRFDNADEGATKFLKVNGLIVRGNHVHHNYGNGLWTDHENLNTVYEDNLVEYNEGVGIFHEISFNAIIRNNTLRHNSAADGKSLFYGAQIYLNNSKDIEIYGNYVEGPYHAIGIFGSDRGSGAYGPFETKNVKVHDNEIHMSGQAMTGALGWDYVTDPASGNEFYNNKYYVPDENARWRWGGSNLSWSQWQATGNGTGSSRIIE